MIDLYDDNGMMKLNTDDKNIVDDGDDYDYEGGDNECLDDDDDVNDNDEDDDNDCGDDDDDDD